VGYKLPQSREQRNKCDEKWDPCCQNDFLGINIFNQAFRYLQMVVVTREWIYLHIQGFLHHQVQVNIFHLTMLHWIR